MYKNLKVAIVIPAYNEEALIEKTIDSVPEFIDHIIVINDGSTDQTQTVLDRITKSNRKIIIITNNPNEGLGSSMVKGFKKGLKTDADLFCVIAGDAQCDTSYISRLADELISNNLDYVKANRFFHLDALAAMPTYRRVGNIIITILTKFSTGYYSVSDTQNGYAIFTRQILEKISLSLIGKRYDYENTLLTALSIAGAKVRDYPVPAIYGDEKSTIPVVSTALRAIKATQIGFWKRIYYKYILFSFHPIALFLFSGITLMVLGFIIGAYQLIERIFVGISPSSGTVMLAVLPIILGFQLVLTAFILDVNNEGK